MAPSADPSEKISHAIHLRRDGTSLLLDLHYSTAEDTSQVGLTHWGEDLGDLTRAEAEAYCRQYPAKVGLVHLPERAGFVSAVEAVRGTRVVSPSLTLTQIAVGEAAATFGFMDLGGRLAAQVELALGAGGVLSHVLAVQNETNTPITIRTLRTAFRLPGDATAVEGGTDRILGTTPDGRTYGVQVPDSGLSYTVTAAAHLLGTDRAHLRLTTTFAGNGFDLAPGTAMGTPLVLAAWGDSPEAYEACFTTLWDSLDTPPSEN